MRRERLAYAANVPSERSIETKPLTTPDGLRLEVARSGPEVGGLEVGSPEVGGLEGAPALVFLHGISLSGAVWREQLRGSLAQRHLLVAPDLRGHGASDKPAEAHFYQDGARWAGDIRALLSGLERPVLVAASYGGILALDYLEHFGSGDVAGLVLVGALARNGVRAAFADLGPGASQLQGMMRPDFETQYPASRAFVRALTHRPLPDADTERLLALTMMTPPFVRRSLGARRVEHDATLERLELSVLVIQGEEDAVVKPDAGARLAGLARRGRLERLPGVGHSPFLEVPETFDALVADFAASL